MNLTAEKTAVKRYLEEASILFAESNVERKEMSNYEECMIINEIAKLLQHENFNTK